MLAGRGATIIHWEFKMPWRRGQSAGSFPTHGHERASSSCITGIARITRGREVALVLSEDESTYIPMGTTHRLENPGKVAVRSAGGLPTVLTL